MTEDPTSISSTFYEIITKATMESTIQTALIKKKQAKNNKCLLKFDSKLSKLRSLYHNTLNLTYALQFHRAR